MTRRVSVRFRATSDLVRIAAFIASKVDLRSATRWREQADHVIQALSQDADIWPAAEEVFSRDVRCRIFGKRRHVYRILFTIGGETVNVLRIRHAAQDALSDDDL